jgi:S1-C subfamily serine protease
VYQAVQSSAPVSTALVGGALFTFEGERLGLIAECEHETIVIAWDSVLDTLRTPPSIEQQVEQALGIRIEEAKSPSCPVGPEDCPEDTVVVGLWAGSRGKEGGVEPGDVIVNADQQEVKSTKDLEGLLEAGEHTLKVRRGHRLVSVLLASSGSASDESEIPVFGVTLRDTSRGPTVSFVSPDSTAQRAGVLPGDIVIRAGKNVFSSASVAARALADSRTATVLTLDRGGKEFEVLLTP